MAIEVNYSVDKKSISFLFEGDDNEVITAARELTNSNILDSYSHGGVSINLSNPQKAQFNIYIDLSSSIRNLLWYLRTQLKIEIEPSEIQQAAQHFKSSYYQGKLWANILYDAAVNAKQDSPLNLKKLLTYRTKFEMEHKKDLIKKHESADTDIKPLLTQNLPPQTSYTSSLKFGFFALASASALTALAFNVLGNNEENSFT